MSTCATMLRDQKPIPAPVSRFIDVEGDAVGVEVEAAAQVELRWLFKF